MPRSIKKQTTIGLILVIGVLFMPEGVIGKLRRKQQPRAREVGDPVPPSSPPQEALDSRLRGNDGAVAAETAPAPPPPTLQDVEALTGESDFSAFTGRGVQPEVSNAAMKKLFSDPRYNVMDGLDTYIDDYSKPDPIPPAMLRQLASAKFLKLFDDEEKEEAAQRPPGAGGGDDADGPPAAGVAQSGLCNELPSQPESPRGPASRTDHADPDLRLQQDHAAPGKNPGDGAA